MTAPEDRPPDVLWAAPPTHSAAGRPGWALPVLAIGILCALVVAAVSRTYFQGQAEGDSPSLAMAYTFMLGPFLAVGVPLVVIGALGAIRPWSSTRPWLKVVVAAGGIGLFLIALIGPGFLFSKPQVAGTGTVAGLPGQASGWSGSVECTRAGETLRVVAAVPGSTLSRDALSTSLNVGAIDLADEGTAYEIHVDVRADGTEFMIWAQGIGSALSPAITDVAADGANGTFTSLPVPILHPDDPLSTVDIAWDCD